MSRLPFQPPRELAEDVVAGQPPEALDERIVERLSSRNRKQSLSSGTKETYKAIIRDFNRFLSQNQLPFNEESLKRYFEERSDRLRANTLNLRKYALLKCIKAQVGQDSLSRTVMVEKVFEQIPTYQTDKAVPREKCLTEDEIQRLLAAAKTNKTRLLIHFLFKSACRITEALSIRLIDCQLIHSHVRIRILGKGKKERQIEIPKALYDEIRRVYQGKIYLFESKSGRQLNRSNVLVQIKRVARRCGWNISPHCLRHSRATDLHEHKNQSLKAVSRYLGHSSIAITADLYIHTELDYHQVFQLDKV